MRSQNIYCNLNKKLKGIVLVVRDIPISRKILSKKVMNEMEKKMKIIGFNDNMSTVQKRSVSLSFLQKIKLH